MADAGKADTTRSAYRAIDVNTVANVVKRFSGQLFRVTTYGNREPLALAPFRRKNERLSPFDPAVVPVGNCKTVRNLPETVFISHVIFLLTAKTDMAILIVSYA